MFNGTTTTPANRVLMIASDSDNPNPANPGTGELYSAIGNIIIDGLTPQACQPATAIGISNVTTNSATASWAPPAGGSAINQYNWEVRSSGSGGSGATGLVASGNTSTTDVNITGLVVILPIHFM